MAATLSLHLVVQWDYQGTQGCEQGRRAQIKHSAVGVGPIAPTPSCPADYKGHRNICQCNLGDSDP